MAEDEGQPAQAPRQFHAAHARQADIQQEHVETLGRGACQRLERVVHYRHRVAARFQQQAQGHGRILVVVHQHQPQTLRGVHA